MSASLESIERRNPEWRPWLAVIREVLAETEDTAWDAAVPQRLGLRQADAPLLAGTGLSIDSGIGCGIQRAQLDRLLRKLPRSRPEAVTALLPFPLLHACRRRFADEIPEGWSRGYCPLCGAWPTLAEICGVERARHLRCAACGSAWRMHGLACPYCGMADHEKLGSLVPQQPGSNAVVEVCHGCHGYLKALTVLRPAPPAQVMLEDLASVELDLAAAERGYRRPIGAGYELKAARP